MEWAIIIGLVVVVIAAVAGFRIKIYNDLVTRRNKVKNSWAHIEAQLQRRFDLIPNLIDVVKGFAIHERRILDNVTASIGEYVNAQSSQEKLAANEQLTSLLKSLYNVTDNYPQLKSNANFLQLQSALTEIEEDISYARQFYNDAVTIYNNQLMKFPNNIIAQKYGFKEEEHFTAAQNNGTTPKVDLRYTTKRECPICGASVSSDDVDCKYCGCSLV
jgi:LemA protein